VEPLALAATPAPVAATWVATAARLAAADAR
jgi:hypothetical protein